ncbi:hypothetical protein ACTD5D_09460 [Nocardia takedensis]|uniref:hypothetical protein n=1 Tax=Nocardia takedensis TaxID=259390 RepID=UPI003F766E0B
MVVVLGLVILLAAVIVGVAGIFGNDGAIHSLGGEFSVFGYHVTGSTGTLFLYGIVVGAVAMLGLAVLFAGARRNSRRARLARRELEYRGQGGLAGEDVTTVAPSVDRPPRSWRHPFGGAGSTAAPTAAR